MKIRGVEINVTVKLPKPDLAFVDRYAAARGLTRSTAVQHAVAQLRTVELAGEYETAFTEWRDSGEAAAWDAVVADGLAGS